MSSVGCPRCEESFRVPDATLPEGLRLRCPWCNETFKLSEIAPRLLPMVELIGDDDQPIDLSRWMQPAMALGTAGAVSQWASTGSDSDNHATDRLPLYEPMSRIEPGSPDDDLMEFEADTENAIGYETESAFTLDQTVAIDGTSRVETKVDEQADLNDADFEGNEGLGLEDADLELGSPNSDDPQEVFTSDQFDPSADTEEASFDLYQTTVENENEERVPVTGPVPPRPLGSPAGSEFGGGGLNAKPRRKKKSSPLLQVLGVVAGGIASVPLAAGILYMAGKSPDFGFWPFDGTLGKGPEINVSQPMELRDDRVSRPPATGRSLAEDLNPQAEDSSSADNSESSSDSETPEAPSETVVAANDAGRPGDGAPPSIDSLDASEMKLGESDLGSQEALKMPTTTTDLPATGSVASGSKQPVTDEIQKDALEPRLEKETSLEMPNETAVAEASTSEAGQPSLPELAANATEPESPKIEMPAVDTAAETTPADLQDTAPKPDAVASQEPSTEASSSPRNSSTPDVASESPGKENPPAASSEPAATPELLAALDQTDSALKEVVEFKDLTDTKGLKRSKAKLYAALANIASFPAGPSARPAAIVEQVAKAGLMNDLTAAAPNWLRYAGRTNDGIFAVGKVVESKGEWVLKWNGASDLTLQNVDGAQVKSGDDVVIIGKIVNPAQPATIQITYIQSKPAT